MDSRGDFCLGVKIGLLLFQPSGNLNINKKKLPAFPYVWNQCPVAVVFIKQPTLDDSYAVLEVTGGNACQVNKWVKRLNRGGKTQRDQGQSEPRVKSWSLHYAVMQFSVVRNQTAFLICHIASSWPLWSGVLLSAERPLTHKHTCQLIYRRKLNCAQHTKCLTPAIHLVTRGYDIFQSNFSAASANHPPLPTSKPACQSVGSC